jgi:DNA repair photolyase
MRPEFPKGGGGQGGPGKSAQAGPPRGTCQNPKNRFEALARERDPDWDDAEEPLPRTQFIPDLTQSIITHNDSPDIPYSASLNPYRGCEHGCIYCYARPTHEYLGFSAGLDFESRIVVKPRAPELLREQLASPRYQPEPLALSGVTDPYQPIERRLQLTRRCLEVLAEFRHPVGLVTKNQLVTRDLDLLKELARHRAVSVSISLITLDPELRRVLEPRTSPPAARLEAMAKLAGAGIPVGVLVAPVIPGLTDHEMPAVLAAAASAGANYAYYTALRLPLGVGPLFEDWLARHFPDRKDKVLGRIRAMHGGNLYDSRFGRRMRGEGPVADQINALFRVARRHAGLSGTGPELSTGAFRRPAGGQLELF